MGGVGASIAALAFTFSAFMTVWLLHQHTAAALCIPWLLWATAWLIRKPSARTVGVLALLVALQLLAGHPETAYHSGLLVGGFALFELFQTGKVQRSTWKLALGLLGLWGLAYLLGTLIAAVQILPFLEYSADSMAVLRRVERQNISLGLPLQYAWTFLSPDLFGNPAQRNWWGPTFNYNETNGYVGVLPVVLAPLALVAADRARRRLAQFLVVVLVLALGVVYQAPILYDVLMALPGMRLVISIRLLLLAQVCIALLAGLGAEALWEQLPTHRRRLILGVTATVLALLAVGWGLPALLAYSYFQLPAGVAQVTAVWQASLWREGALLLGCGLVVAGLGWVWTVRRRWAYAAFGVLPLLLVGDLWQARIGYLPTVAPDQYFPDTAATRFLQQQAGLFRVIGAPGVFPPNTNLRYGVAHVDGYDAVQAREHYDLLTRAARVSPAQTGATPSGLMPTPIWNLLNVRYILVPPGDDPNYVIDVRQEVSDGKTVGEIYGSSQPGQTFVANSDNLAQVQVLGATFGGQARGHLTFHLKTSPTAPTDLVTQDLAVEDLPNNSFWTISFPPIRQSKGHPFYFYFEAPAARPGQAATLWYTQQTAYPQGSRTESGQPVDGDLAFRTEARLLGDDLPYREVLTGGATAASIYENTAVLPRAWIANQVEVEPDAEARLRRLRDPAFDAQTTVLLAEPPPAAWALPAGPASPGSAVATIASYKPEEVIITTQGSTPGVLVLSDLAFPGWGATLDGVAVPILTADSGLQAVYVPAGSHTVRFQYAPLSMTFGGIVSGAATLLLLALLLKPARRALQRPSLPIS